MILEALTEAALLGGAFLLGFSAVHLTPTRTVDRIFNWLKL